MTEICTSLWSGSSTVHVISAGNCFRKKTSELEAWNGYLRTAVRVLSCSLISAIARLFPPRLFLYAGVFVRVDDCLSFVESVRIACTVDRLQLRLLPRCFRSGRPNTLFSEIWELDLPLRIKDFVDGLNTAGCSVVAGLQKTSTDTVAQVNSKTPLSAVRNLEVSPFHRTGL